MRRLLKGCIAIATTLTLGACSQPPTVAVVDVDNVIEKTPLSTLLVNSMQEARTQLASELGGGEARIKEKISAFKQKVGVPPSEQEQQVLQKMNKELAVLHKNAIQKANQKMAQLEKELTQSALVHIRRAAKEVADEKGYEIVLTKNDKSLLYYSEGVDITVDVAQKVIHKGNKAAGFEE